MKEFTATGQIAWESQSSHRAEDYQRWFRTLDAQIKILERERQKFSAVVHHTDAGFLVVDSSLTILWANQIFNQKFSTTPKSTPVIGTKCNQGLCGQSAICQNCPGVKPFETGQVAHQEFSLQIEGKERNIYATSIPIKSPDGNITETIIMLQDITDLEVLRQSQEALKTSEERFRSIFEKAAAGMVAVSTEGKIMQANPAFCDMLGYSAEEVVQLNISDLTHPNDREISLQYFQEMLLGKRESVEIEKRYIRKDKSIVVGKLSATCLRDEHDRPLYLVGLVQDLTQRKRAEQVQSVIYNIAQATTLAKNLPQLIKNIHHQLGTLIDTTNFYVALYNRELEVYSFPYYVDQYDKYDNPEIQKLDLKKSLTDFVRRTGQPLLADEKIHAALMQKGEVDMVGSPSKVWLGVPLITGQGVIGVVTVQSYTDQSTYSEKDLELLSFVSDNIALAIQRKQSEEELRVSQERLSTVVNKAPLILFGLDRNGVFTFSEGKGLEQLGLRPNEVVGKSVYEVYADLPQILENVSRALNGEELTSVVEARERVYETWYAPLRDISGEIQGVIGVANDITERSRAEKALRQSEEQLLHSQKMEAMGRLAGGVAHDFNNLLTVILGHCDFLQRRLESNDAVQRDIDLIKSTSNRAVSLTRQLLAFSRRQVQQPKIIDLNAVVSDMERMVLRLIGEDIDLVFDPGENLGLVKADLGQVEQVILNLVVNARDAMPQGGRLSIHTENVDLDDTYQQKRMAVKPGRYVMLAVTDTGTGIDKDVIPHIFEPFFTTKEKGRGTGLGLSTVYGIVKQSQGNVWVYSEQNQGTAFKVYLPRCDGAKLQKETAQVAVATAAGSETILLMEDEEAVRALAREILMMYGYTVLEAVTPEEAFVVCKQHDGKIHLLLSDVIMPHMNGPELAECLRSTRPDMKVLFMSGYTGDTIFSQGAIDVGTPFLQKPFTVDSLARKVRQVLDEAEQVEKNNPGIESTSG